MERLSLNKAAKSDKAAAARLAGLDQVRPDETATFHFVRGVRCKGGGIGSGCISGIGQQRYANKTAFIKTNTCQMVARTGFEIGSGTKQHIVHVF